MQGQGLLIKIMFSLRLYKKPQICSLSKGQQRGHSRTSPNVHKVYKKITTYHLILDLNKHFSKNLVYRIVIG